MLATAPKITRHPSAPLDRLPLKTHPLVLPFARERTGTPVGLHVKDFWS
jgi:hypothetical protein